MLYVGFGDEGAVDELLVARSTGEDSASLEPGDDRRHGRLRQLSLVVQLLPDLCDGELALFPKEAKHGDLELGQLLAVGHQTPLGFYRCRFYKCRTRVSRGLFQVRRAITPSNSDTALTTL